MRVGHVKFSEVSLQHRGRGLLGLQGWHLLLKAEDPAQQRDGKSLGIRKIRQPSKSAAFIVS